MLQAVKMSQAAKALAGSLAASAAASQSAAQPRQLQGLEEQHDASVRQALQPLPKVLSVSPLHAELPWPYNATHVPLGCAYKVGVSQCTLLQLLCE